MDAIAECRSHTRFLFQRSGGPSDQPIRRLSTLPITYGEIQPARNLGRTGVDENSARQPCRRSGSPPDSRVRIVAGRAELCASLSHVTGTAGNRRGARVLHLGGEGTMVDPSQARPPYRVWTAANAGSYGKAGDSRTRPTDFVERFLQCRRGQCSGLPLAARLSHEWRCTQSWVTRFKKPCDAC